MGNHQSGKEAKKEGKLDFSGLYGNENYKNKNLCLLFI
jgi:hypothetical protein